MSLLKDPESIVFVSFWSFALVWIILCHYTKWIDPTVGVIVLLATFVFQILLRCYLVSAQRKKLEAEVQSNQQSSNS